MSLSLAWLLLGVSALPDDARPLTALVPEGSAGLALLHNPAAAEVVAIDANRILCIPQAVAATLPSARLACRDRRLALKWLGPNVTHHYSDGVHGFAGPIADTSDVVLFVGDQVAMTWTLEPHLGPVEGRPALIARQTQSLILDLTCSGDVAVARWVVWRGFPVAVPGKGRSTRAIGPDLRCRTQREDPHAVVVRGGSSRIDLTSGTVRPIDLAPSE